MDILSFETRDKQRVEVTHAVVSSSTLDAVEVGDHILRLATPGGMTQITLNPEQWGRLVDSLAMTIARKH